MTRKLFMIKWNKGTVVFKQFMKYLKSNKKNKLISSVFENKYIKSVNSEAELQLYIQQELKKTTFKDIFVLHKDSISGALTRISVRKNKNNQFECISELI